MNKHRGRSGETCRREFLKAIGVGSAAAAMGGCAAALRTTPENGGEAGPETPAAGTTGGVKVLPWAISPSCAVPIGAGFLLNFNVPMPRRGMRSRIAYTPNGEQLVPVLEKSRERQSYGIIGALGDMVYAVFAGSFEPYATNRPSTGPSTLWTTSNGTEWTEVPLPAEMRMRWPIYLFGFEGGLFLQTRDMPKGDRDSPARRSRNQTFQKK